jgi:hypothetical protein
MDSSGEGGKEDVIVEKENKEPVTDRLIDNR